MPTRSGTRASPFGTPKKPGREPHRAQPGCREADRVARVVGRRARRGRLGVVQQEVAGEASAPLRAVGEPHVHGVVVDRERDQIARCRGAPLPGGVQRVDDRCRRRCGRAPWSGSATARAWPRGSRPCSPARPALGELGRHPADLRVDEAEGVAQHRPGHPVAVPAHVAAQLVEPPIGDVGSFSAVETVWKFIPKIAGTPTCAVPAVVVAVDLVEHRLHLVCVVLGVAVVRRSSRSLGPRAGSGRSSSCRSRA